MPLVIHDSVELTARRLSGPDGSAILNESIHPVMGIRAELMDVGKDVSLPIRDLDGIESEGQPWRAADQTSPDP